MSLFAALIYWIIVALWLTVLGAILYFYLRNPRTFGMARTLLAILAIDTARNIFENIYFGVYFGGKYGLFPAATVSILGQPGLLVLPKILDVIAGSVVLALLLLHRLPKAVKERSRAEHHAGELRTLAVVDWLTGVHNRRHFEALLRAELARSKRSRRPLSVLMIDIDRFKAVNDHLGYPAGDRVLQSIAAVCLAAKRAADVVARVGGEEFAMMLPETTDGDAAQFAERLRQHMRTSAPTVDDKKVSISVSIGIAAATMTTSGSEALLRCAHQALDDAKRAGRDRVAVWRPPITVPPAVAAE